MKVGLARRGVRNDLIQAVAKEREVLWPSLSMSGDMWAYCGRALASMSRWKEWKSCMRASLVPFWAIRSKETKGLCGAQCEP